MSESKEILDLKNDVRKLRVRIASLETENLDLNAKIQASGQLMFHLHPVLYRLINLGALLEKKGLFNAKELAGIQEQEQQSFINAAHTQLTEKMRDQSEQTRTVASDNGNSGSGLPGVARSGRSPACDQIPPDSELASVAGLSDLRTAPSPSDGTPDVGSTEAKDVPLG